MKFDVDVSKLVAGCTVEQSTCEEIIGFPRRTDMYRYQFLVMQLAEHIRRLLWREGHRWTVITEDGAIRVLTHEEASKYNASRFDCAIQKMRRCNRRLIAVDAGKLPPDARYEHTEQVVRQSRILQGLKESAKDLDPIPATVVMPKRKT